MICFFESLAQFVGLKSLAWLVFGEPSMVGWFLESMVGWFLESLTWSDLDIRWFEDMIVSRQVTQGRRAAGPK